MRAQFKILNILGFFSETPKGKKNACIYYFII